MSSYRLGFPVRVIGAPLRPHDSRRWQNHPHLSVSLAYLRDIFEYLHKSSIYFYRLSGQLAPYNTHPHYTRFHRQIEECATELAAIGDLARQYQLRLTLHPAHYVQMSSPDTNQLERATRELNAATAILDAMGLGTDSVIVVHVGGTYGNRLAGRERFVQAFHWLDAAVRQRLALEHDDRSYSLQDTLWIHQRTGIRVVLDTLHHHCLDPTGIDMSEALIAALRTWPVDERPKVHFSSPRTALRRFYHNGRWRVQAPLPNQHSDFIHPFEFINFLRTASDATSRAFDIMLEAKAQDLALLRLRDQVARFAPDLCSCLR